MSLFSEPAVRSQLKAIGRAFILLLGLGLGVVLLYLVFIFDAMSNLRVRELGPIELAQSVMLATTTGLYFLDFIRHGFWVYPALALAFGCIAYACTDLRRTLAGLERFVRWKYFPFLIIGLVIVLAYSRLFGSGYGWKLLLGDRFVYSMKAGVEESSELLGYLFILSSAVLANADKRLN